MLNGAEETRRTTGSDGLAVTTGLTREEGQGEQRGLLNRESDDEDAMPSSPGGDVPIL